MLGFKILPMYVITYWWNVLSYLLSSLFNCRYFKVGAGDLGIVSVALSIRTVGTKTGNWGHCTLGDKTEELQVEN